MQQPPLDKGKGQGNCVKFIVFDEKKRASQRRHGFQLPLKVAQLSNLGAMFLLTLLLVNCNVLCMKNEYMRHVVMVLLFAVLFLIITVFFILSFVDPIDENIKKRTRLYAFA